MTLYKDRRVEDYEYNAKTGFTDCEQGEKMNEVKDERRQVSRKAEELVIAIDYLIRRVDALETRLEKVIVPKRCETTTAMSRESGLAPLAEFLDGEKCRIAELTWKLADIMDAIEL